MLCFFKFFYVVYFFFFRLHWVFVAACGLSLVAASRGYSLLWCAGFSLQWLFLLQRMGSRHAGFSSCGLRALERRLCSCGSWASLLRSMWDLPRPGIKPMSPALAGGFLTTGPPRKSLHVVYLFLFCYYTCFPSLLFRLGNGSFRFSAWWGPPPCLIEPERGTPQACCVSAGGCLLEGAGQK